MWLHANKMTMWDYMWLMWDYMWLMCDAWLHVTVHDSMLLDITTYDHTRLSVSIFNFVRLNDYIWLPVTICSWSWSTLDCCRCPQRNIISPFVYDKSRGMAEAKLFSMFKFPESNRVHFQCDILVCRGALNPLGLINQSAHLPQSAKTTKRCR